MMFLLFQKRSKSVSSASQKTLGYPAFGEADPGGLGACPQQNSALSSLFFSGVSSASQKTINQLSAKPTQGVWGRAPAKLCVKQFLLFQKRSKSVGSTLKY
jgi:hypothetical protein